ncbi:hypothetical protein CGMCC3_g3200 [Colletotrichum fructicola]|nr:uncharacterized protein CGMCC3_g3200 [Colletotrichum fructicola]KAE9581092.1 hypothetical protein CGMCC3_g3200 [Colletotrichum fructicola]
MRTAARRTARDIPPSSRPGCPRETPRRRRLQQMS